MKSPREHALVLLTKAAHDLVAANATIQTGKALDTVCFHCQQAAEKSLKALLALKEIEYPWRHDLGELLELVAPHFSEFRDLKDAVMTLAPFAVVIRYEGPEPDAETSRSALTTASKVHSLVGRIIGAYPSPHPTPPEPPTGHAEDPVPVPRVPGRPAPIRPGLFHEGGAGDSGDTVA